MLLQQGMDETITATYALKQDTPRCLFEEEDDPPRKCMALCEKQSEYIMPEIGSSTSNQPDNESADQPQDQPDY
jgi:hypothetical protein